MMKGNVTSAPNASSASGSHGDSLTKKKVEAACEVQSIYLRTWSDVRNQALKRVHEKDVQNLLKEVKAYHKKSTSKNELHKEND